MRTLRNSFALLSLSALAAAFPLTAQTRDAGSVVVTATRHETDLRSVSTTATVITSEQIEQHGWKNVVDVLRDELSVDIAQSGGPGGLSYPQVRGLPGKYLVVLIDGVRVNDPTDANGGPGTIFSHMTTADIARIEVIRGAMSSLYGSNAAGGVINIITKSGSGDGELSLAYEGGSLASNRVDFGYSVASKGWSLRADQNFTDTDGLIDEETYRNYTTSVKLGYSLPDMFDWESLVRYANTEQNFADLRENFGGEPWTLQIADPDQKNKFNYLTFGTRIGHNLFPNWRQELNAGISRRERKTADHPDGVLADVPAPVDGFTVDYANFYNRGEVVAIPDDNQGSFEYTGQNIDIDYRHTGTFSGESAGDIMTFGFEYLYRDYDQTGDLGTLATNVGNVAGYAHNQLLLLDDALSFNTGVRFDDHEQAGGSTTGSAGLAWDIRRIGLVLRANYGTAFRAPSVYELYASTPYTTGNPNLEPEDVTSWEAGFEKYSWGGKFRLLASTWHTEAENAIISVYDPNTWMGSYENADRAESDGVEVGIRAELNPAWRVGFNYTYTDSRSYSSSGGSWSRMIQVPYNKFNLNATWLFWQGASLTLDGYWVDDSRLRWSLVDKMDSYFKLDLAARVPLYEHFELSLRVQNLLDEDYNESYGIREAGFCAFGGIRLKY